MFPGPKHCLARKNNVWDSQTLFEAAKQCLAPIWHKKERGRVRETEFLSYRISYTLEG